MNYNSLYKLVSTRQATIGVIGLGYVGLPLSILFSKKGFKVIGFDIDKKKIEQIDKRKSYIDRISSKEIAYILKKGFCTSDFSNVLKCDFIIICVPTPLKKNKPNLEYLKFTIKNIKNFLKPYQAIVLESTSYPGTTREMIGSLLDKKFNLGKNFYLGFSSERINPGFNENSINKIPKVVSGYSEKCLEIIKFFYKKSFKNIVPAKSLEMAEFSKLLENIYRSVNIGFVNEMKLVADKMGLDIFEILKLAKTKPFGFQAFEPGPGIGGHCIPIDPNYLHWRAKKFGIDTKFIKLSEKINLEVLKFIISKINFIKKNKNLRKNFNILILGLSYKKNVDDLRESASLKLIEYLNKKKINFQFSDPYVTKKIQTRSIDLSKKSLKLNKKNLKKFDITILMTDHDAFNYDLIYKNSNMIIDCRGRYSIDNKVIRA
ncbi:nucleotide sugar dehydrogenase [Candidatus Pelagibacter sp.]|uniref:nucleotide sugar dehydrogenase n=1 Tax=Candidatus Pelagibacter sp. TaxID=2024849 RepID=UPI003F830B3B